MSRQPKTSPARSRASSERAVADRLHSAAIHLLRRLRRVDQVADIGPARLSALSVIVFGGPVTLTRLAEAEQVTGATISRVVSGLEASGLATRRTDERDRRVTWIEATARGRRLLERGRARRVELLRTRLAQLSPEELAALGQAAELLERIARMPE
jgi:DNA-binding MarR family transcriptional regulator